MKIFLIRHGETVDNVAQLYAGSRDSELTNHGHQQANRLGQFFKNNGVAFTHVFASNLKRAAKTAQLVQAAQTNETETRDTRSGTAPAVLPPVLCLPELVEQDFGFYEGKSFDARSATPKKFDQDALDRLTPGFVDVESRESMAARSDKFLEEHLVPLLRMSAGPGEQVVAVVSQGIILSVLWKRLLSRMPPKTVSLHSELLATGKPFILEHLGGWSNTGYLEFHLECIAPVSVPSTMVPVGSAVPVTVPVSKVVPSDSLVSDSASSSSVDGRPFGQSMTIAPFSGWKMVVKTINGRDHLRSLKRTRGGVGSARFDEGQKTLDTFFKRRKV